MVRAALMRACVDEGSERLRHGQVREAGPGQLLLQVGCEPLLGLMLLPRGVGGGCHPND